MRKITTLIIIAIITFISCEKDDICIDPTTPNLVIRFNDFENPKDFKKVSKLTVWANGKDSLYINQTLDSIAIPLDINTNFTIFKLSADEIVDDIHFTYSREDIYVGRSCGFKTNYHNLQIEDNTTNWIKNIEINNITIDNDTAAQVTIFH